MRRVLAPVLLGACLTGPGCSFVRDIARNVVNEPLFACDEVAIRKRHEKLAKQAWDEMVRQYGCFSDDYRDGFIDGFADYLTYGGTSSGDCEEPITPAVPPERYRHKKSMTPEGYQAMEEWFRGFKHGASTAVASGLRQLVVVPVMDPPVFSHQLSEPANSGAAVTPSSPVPESEMLPRPQRVPAGGVPEGPMPPAQVPPGGGGLVRRIPAPH